ncbi:NUDIX hydrolase [Aestuariirhabdus litorea]|uniref:CoA pyrophosphatase n=1 Tax=Aestuariirhabdus litorea TaxID=2528527 RepID=A0A3P3VRV2_9GAMM|nr:CoA pyrophosphatase [Aestuariirhabdus litorea]RRJ85511.1 CoA pyrophosphatase [Aestuariirhabdus litorea]RWW98511.1 NUDIX domain-containing protein [Endozoicomonadaceae bacterium GTF-13]
MIKQLTARMQQHQPRALFSRGVDTELPEAGVLIPLRERGGILEMVLTLRSSQLSTHSGEVAFPGGKWEAGDKDLWHTALRESHEEIGLEPSSVVHLGELGPLVSRFGIKVTPFVGMIPPDAELYPNPDELESIFSVPLAFFLQDNRLRTDPIRFQQKTYHVPAYEYEGYQIWGLTAVMLVELLNVAFDANIPLDVPQLSADNLTR